MLIFVSFAAVGCRKQENVDEGSAGVARTGEAKAGEVIPYKTEDRQMASPAQAQSE